MRKQLYNTDMRSSCRLSHKDGQQHVLSPPDRKVAENTLTAPNSKYVNLKNQQVIKKVHQDMNLVDLVTNQVHIPWTLFNWFLLFIIYI